MQGIPPPATLGRNDTRQSFPRKQESLSPSHVIPAQAGIPFTMQGIPPLATLARNDTRAVIPAQAGMTSTLPQSFLRKQESLSKCRGFLLSLRSAGMTPGQSFPRKRESLSPFHVIPAQAGIPFIMQGIPALATLARNDTGQSFPRKRESLPPFHVIPA